MSVDKFGRFSTHQKFGAAAERGPPGKAGAVGPKGERGPPGKAGPKGDPGNGFDLTADGNYNLTLKQIKQLGAPTEKDDATTKSYVDSEIRRIVDIEMTTLTLYINAEIEKIEQFIFSSIINKEKN